VKEPIFNQLYLKDYKRKIKVNQTVDMRSLKALKIIGFDFDSRLSIILKNLPDF